jgi:putative serine protease PepD
MSEIDKPHAGPADHGQDQGLPATPAATHPVAPAYGGEQPASTEPTAPVGYPAAAPQASPAASQWQQSQQSQQSQSAGGQWQQPQPASGTMPLPPTAVSSGGPIPSAAPASSTPASSSPYGEYQPYSGQPYPGAPGGSSPYAASTPWSAPGQPPAGQPAQPRKGVGAGVKIVVAVAAAGLIALCSGVTGAVVYSQIDGNGGGISLGNTSTEAAPVVDRSTLAGVAATVQPSVVSISTGTGEGSGVVLSKDGYILTNNHVVEGASGNKVTVTLSSGKKLQATIVGTDPKTDMGVVKVDNGGDLTPIGIADSDKVAVGDTVLAVGSPLGLQGSVTAGIISAKDRIIAVGESRTGASMSGLLQTDAPINPGNSGGALVNTNGDLVGINTAIATNGSGEGNIGVGFAIPSNKAKQVAEQLINGEKVSHPFLGVKVGDAESGGARLTELTANGPAEKAGLKVDDVITKFGNRAVGDSDDLVSAVQSGTVGQQVSVEYVRNGETKTATVTLAEAS